MRTLGPWYLVHYLMDYTRFHYLCQRHQEFQGRATTWGSCIRAARRHYTEWLRAESLRDTRPVVVFKIDHAPRHTTEVRLPLEPALVSIVTIRERMKEHPKISRGRPRGDWRGEFEEDMAEIGRSLRATAASRLPVVEDIRAYRARRREPEEVHVTVPA